MMPFKHLSKALNILDTKKTWWDESKEKVELLPYSWYHWYNDQDWLHPARCWRRFLHVVKWIPFLWRDQDWDYCFLYEMMEIKLRHMKEHHLQEQLTGDWKEIAAQLEAAEQCVRRLRNENYCEEEYEKHRKKYPKDFFDQLIPANETHFVQKPMGKREATSLKKIWEQEEKRRQADLDLFCKLFKEHSRGWWV